MVDAYPGVAAWPGEIDFSKRPGLLNHVIYPLAVIPEGLSSSSVFVFLVNKVRISPRVLVAIAAIEAIFRLVLRGPSFQDLGLFGRRIPAVLRDVKNDFLNASKTDMNITDVNCPNNRSITVGRTNARTEIEMTTVIGQTTRTTFLTKLRRIPVESVFIIIFLHRNYI